MNCPECGITVYKEVCINCGCVIEEMYIKNDLIPRKYDNKNYIDLSGSFRSPLSPDIEYEHIYPKHTNKRDLNRAFQRQKQEKHKSEKQYYFRDFKEIERVCNYLQLPKTLLQEALNIRKQIGKDNDYFKRRKHYKIMACVKIAAKIHDYPLNEMDFIELTKNYPIIGKNENISLRGNPIKTEIDKYYIDILHNKLNLILLDLKKTKYISYVCSELGINHDYELYTIYGKILKFFNPSCSIKGYVLGLIHLLYGKREKIRIIELEDKFNINRATIAARKNELKKILERINYAKT